MPTWKVTGCALNTLMGGKHVLQANSGTNNKLLTLLACGVDSAELQLQLQ